jgi:protein-tyrosine phosphatase
LDRVGYVAGAYLMKNAGVSLREAMGMNFEVMEGMRSSMNSKSFNGLQWYCLYLKRNEEECEIQNNLNMANLYTEDNQTTKNKVQNNKNRKHSKT